MIVRSYFQASTQRRHPGRHGQEAQQADAQRPSAWRLQSPWVRRTGWGRSTRLGAWGAAAPPPGSGPAQRTNWQMDTGVGRSGRAGHRRTKRQVSPAATARSKNGRLSARSGMANTTCGGTCCNCQFDANNLGEDDSHGIQWNEGWTVLKEGSLSQDRRKPDRGKRQSASLSQKEGPCAALVKSCHIHMPYLRTLCMCWHKPMFKHALGGIHTSMSPFAQKHSSMVASRASNFSWRHAHTTYTCTVMTRHGAAKAFILRQGGCNRRRVWPRQSVLRAHGRNQVTHLIVAHV